MCTKCRFIILCLIGISKGEISKDFVSFFFKV